MSRKQQTNKVRTNIARRLAPGEFVSGEELASELTHSRSAVANHVKALSELGLDIFSVKGRGYKLSQPISLLNADIISDALTHKHHKHQANIEVKNIIGSTNDELKSVSSELSNGSVILAEAQTDGRGRHGRKWVSPFGSNLYMSMLWSFESGYQSMAGLSLLIGIAVKRAVANLGFAGCALKWPNDVYINNKKLAGILIEVEGQAGGLTQAIIGIGINVQMPESVENIDQPFTDLSAEMQSSIDRNALACELIHELWTLIPTFEKEGLLPFIQEWQDADVFRNRMITLISGKHSTEGVCRGIDNSGALLIEQNGQIKAYHGGELSVRAN